MAMNLVTAFFGRRQKIEAMKPVVDPATITEPVDFYSPDFPYEQGFKEIDAYVRKLPEKGYVPVSDILRLQFYSLYKQATAGDIDESKVKQPSMFRDWEGYWKVVGWRKCKGMPRERARDLYIDLFDSMIKAHLDLKWGATLAEDRWGAFYDGVQRIQNLPKNGYHLADELRAHVYAIFKQATVGNLKDFQKSELAKTEKKYKWLRSRPTKPGFDQYRYDEWKKLEGMSSERAKRYYCKEVFREGAMYGYVWNPPGTEGHLEVIGDETSAKTFKRIDEEALKNRFRVEVTPDDEDVAVKAIEGAGVKLSVLERSALRTFVKKEAKELEAKEADPLKKAAAKKASAAEEVMKFYVPTKEETAAAKEAHADPSAMDGSTSATSSGSNGKMGQGCLGTTEVSTSNTEEPMANDIAPAVNKEAEKKKTEKAEHKAGEAPAASKKKKITNAKASSTAAAPKTGAKTAMKSR